VDVGKKELTMAGSLINGMSDKWDPHKYHNEYKQALLELIEEKVAVGGKELPVEKGARPKPTKVIDLVSVLQQSLNQASKKHGAKKERTKKRKAA
jgi:DNA end-binding protein Ku